MGRGRPSGLLQLSSFKNRTSPCIFENRKPVDGGSSAKSSPAVDLFRSFDHAHGDDVTKPTRLLRVYRIFFLAVFGLLLGPANAQDFKDRWIVFFDSNYKPIPEPVLGQDGGSVIPDSVR